MMHGQKNIKLATLIKIYCGVAQSLQANSALWVLNWPKQLPHLSFNTHHS